MFHYKFNKYNAFLVNKDSVLNKKFNIINYKNKTLTNVKENVLSHYWNFNYNEVKRCKLYKCL